MWLLKDLQRLESDERIKIILLHVIAVVTIARRSPPTVYAFLNPKFPSATWDFFACDLRSGTFAAADHAAPEGLDGIHAISNLIGELRTEIKAGRHGFAVLS
ncbi:hypothetical protein [Pseudomonas sp. H2_C02]